MRQFIVLMLFFAMASTQCTVEAQAITREQAVQYALKNAESVRIARQNARQTRELGRQTVSFLKPQLELGGAYLEQGTNAPDIPIPELEFQDRQIGAETEFTQLLFAGGRIWRSLELEKNIYTQADQQEILEVREIVKIVKFAFDSVLFQEAVVKILENRLAQRQEEMEDAKDLWDVGMVTGLDVRQANVNVDFAKDALRNGEASLDAALIDFNLALGRSGDAELIVPEGALADESENLVPLIAQLYDRLGRDDILEVKLRKSQAESARLNYEIARGQFYPAVEFVAGARTAGDSADDMDESWRVGVQMEWSILDGGLIRSQAAEADFRRRSAMESLVRTKKEISGRVKKIEVNSDSLRDRAKLQREAVELSKENYEDARSQYRAGTITLVRLGVFNLRYSEARFSLMEIYFLQRRLSAEAEALLEGTDVANR